MQSKVPVPVRGWVRSRVRLSSSGPGVGLATLPHVKQSLEEEIRALLFLF